jgi:hypothetical protein
MLMFSHIMTALIRMNIYRHMSLRKVRRQLRLRTSPNKRATLNETNFLALTSFEFTQCLAPRHGVPCLGFRASFNSIEFYHDRIGE